MKKHESKMLWLEQNDRWSWKRCCHHNETYIFAHSTISTSKGTHDEHCRAHQEGAPLRATPALYPTCCNVLQHPCVCTVWSVADFEAIVFLLGHAWSKFGPKILVYLQAQGKSSQEGHRDCQCPPGSVRCCLYRIKWQEVKTALSASFVEQLATKAFKALGAFCSQE